MLWMIIELTMGSMDENLPLNAIIFQQAETSTPKPMHQNSDDESSKAYVEKPCLMDLIPSPLIYRQIYSPVSSTSSA